MTVRTLNIRLLREGRDIEEAFTETFAPNTNRALQRGPWELIEGATVFVGQIYSNPPKWRSFIEEGFYELSDDIFTGGAGAVIFTPVGSRFAAICFGHIHIALNDDAFERQFGLKVTLNSVPGSNIRSLDLATPDAVTFQKRVQASRDSDVNAFGVDRLRDVARVAGGTPKDPSFARFVAGKDSLSITCELDINDVQKKCNEIFKIYEKTDYKTDFKWVDNLRPVIEKDLIEQLDEKLFVDLGELRKGNPVDLHMSPPEVANYIEGSELHYNGFGSHGATFHSLAITDYISELNRCKFTGDIKEIKEKHRISAKPSDKDQFSEKWKVYDCFIHEASLTSKTDTFYFILFAGNWFQVEALFKDSVNKFFDEIDTVNIIGKTAAHNEQELIANLVETRAADLLKLDREKINPAGVRNANLEPADFLSDKKHFIHLKDGHSSGPISHLWSQGVVSAEAFVGDKEFRKKLRSIVKSEKKGFEVHLPKSTERVVREKYTIVYGIMRQPYADGTLGLPFFSKVSLQVSVERLRKLGFDVAIELIEKPASSAGVRRGRTSSVATSEEAGGKALAKS
ncbi:TIGR04141 family sporadically distributed protein [Salinicola salarius]|uniref:TIGR04141 family sporadically distributed protein n=1 Tax=Salinicola salarius TaxID=430457 RepID=UPI000DA11E45|nr:TIGR04141 family sporadically distributed protein [Salinicola salarius]